MCMMKERDPVFHFDLYSPNWTYAPIEKINQEAVTWESWDIDVTVASQKIISSSSHTEWSPFLSGINSRHALNCLDWQVIHDLAMMLLKLLGNFCTSLPSDLAFVDPIAIMRCMYRDIERQYEMWNLIWSYNICTTYLPLYVWMCTICCMPSCTSCVPFCPPPGRLSVRINVGYA